jgi:hypothetical protein
MNHGLLTMHLIWIAAVKGSRLRSKQVQGPE